MRTSGRARARNELRERIGFSIRDHALRPSAETQHAPVVPLGRDRLGDFVPGADDVCLKRFTALIVQILLRDVVFSLDSDYGCWDGRPGCVMFEAVSVSRRLPPANRRLTTRRSAGP